MPVAAGNGSSLLDQAGQNPSWTHDNNGDGVVVEVSWRGAETIDSVTVGGVAATHIVTATQTTNARAALYYVSDAAPGNLTVQVNFSVAPSGGASMGAVSLIGNDLADALRPGSGVAAVGDSATASVTVTASGTDDLIVGGTAIRGVRLPDSEADQTDVYAEGTGNGAAMSHEPGTATTEVHQYTFPSPEQWAVVAASFQPAAAAAGPITASSEETQPVLRVRNR